MLFTPVNDSVLRAIAFPVGRSWAVEVLPWIVAELSSEYEQLPSDSYSVA